MGEYIQTQGIENIPSEGGSGIEPIRGGGTTGVNTENLLRNHGFTSLDGWSVNGENVTAEIKEDEKEAKYGTGYLRLKTTTDSGNGVGISQVCEKAATGNYTFSAYVKAGVFAG